MDLLSLSLSLHWRWCRWNPFWVIRAKDERVGMMATHREFGRTFRTWFFSPFAIEYRRVTQGGSDCHEDDERGHDADDCRNSSLIQKIAHRFDGARHRHQKVECLQRGLARVADEKASVHSVIRLFGRSDGQRRSQQRIAALHGNNVHNFAIFQLDSVLNFEKMNRSIFVVIKTKTLQCTLSQRVWEFNSLQLQTRSWSSPSWTSLVKWVLMTTSVGTARGGSSTWEFTVEFDSLSANTWPVNANSQSS